MATFTHHLCAAHAWRQDLKNGYGKGAKVTQAQYVQWYKDDKMRGPGRESYQRRLAVLAEQVSARHSSDVVVYSKEVESALREGRPVVALESTIVAHGMPYPQNLQTALEVEAVVRQQNAVPATIAILQGVPRIGLTHEELKYIALRGGAIRKVSRRDLPHVCALRMDGATTVSATMLLAVRAGISVFVTGGIGGVHRGGEETMDVSADLTELGRTPILVVCAGAKSILDIPRTLEYLETQGACVSAYCTDEFPAFFTRESGCRAPCRFDTPEQVAEAMHVIKRLQLGSGMVLGVPIPEEHAAVGIEVQHAISRALKEGVEQGVKGNQVTPFLLKRVKELTDGKSLESNIHLVKNNAKIGACIACALSAMSTTSAPSSSL